MTTKKKAAAKPDLKPGDAALPTHDGTDTVDQDAQDGHAARLATMANDTEPKDAGQTATVSGVKKG